MESKQTPKQIFDDQTKRKIILKEIATSLTIQLDFVYNYLMGFKQPTAQELIDEVSNRKIIYS